MFPLKRAHYIFKRDIHLPCKLLALLEIPDFHAKETYVYSKEPCIY